MTLQNILSAYFEEEVSIAKESPISGGSINNTYSINSSKGNFFVKENDSERYPRMFESEAKGLKLIQSKSCIKTPEIITLDNNSRKSYLILELIENGKGSIQSWGSLGSGLANLHKNSNDSFGLEHNNYIGSLPQTNIQYGSWGTFYINQRLEPMVRQAYDNGSFENSILKTFNRFYKELPSIYPIEPPALLHGDLWSGNFLFNNNEEAVLIDPAVYYGHREMDLGMSLLFGGFDEAFYKIYHETYPLEADWKNRVPYSQLYPLLVHVNLFGGGYKESVARIINKF